MFPTYRGDIIGMTVDRVGAANRVYVAQADGLNRVRLLRWDDADSNSVFRPPATVGSTAGQIQGINTDTTYVLADWSEWYEIDERLPGQRAGTGQHTFYGMAHDTNNLYLLRRATAGGTNVCKIDVLTKP